MAAPLYPVTKLDADQTLEHAYDETIQGYRTSATATIAGDVQVEIDAVDGDNIALADASGTKVTVTTVGPDVGLDVNIVGGDIHIKAPTGPFQITVGTANDTATNPLFSPLTGRVSIAVRNKSLSTTIYFGKNASVTPDDTATGGWEIGPSEDFSIDLDDSESFFLITPTGETAVYKILEIASQ